MKLGNLDATRKSQCVLYYVLSRVEVLSVKALSYRLMLVLELYQTIGMPSDPFHTSEIRAFAIHT